MNIPSVNLINFGIKKITHKKAYLKQLPKTSQQQDSFEYVSKDKSAKQKIIYKTPNPNDDMCFDKLFDKQTCIIDGNTIISKEAGAHSTAIELTEYDGNKVNTTSFKVDKKHGEKSSCSFRMAENNKPKKMMLSWDFPNRNFNYKGSNKDLTRFKKAIQHFRNIIQSKEYFEDFGNMEDVNTQIKLILGYLHSEINKQENK